MKKLFIILALWQVFLLPASGQTNSKNYVISHTYKQAGADVNDVSRVVTQVQYIDGLGRPIQTVVVGQSPAGTDIVTPMAYDDLGRQARQYLPYVATGNGSFKTAALQTGPTSASVFKFYLDNSASLQAGTPTTQDLDRPFSETVFEASPLNRTSTQQGPGTRSRSSSVSYKVNITGEVKRYDYDPATNTITTPGNYAAGTLYRTQYLDEQNSETNEYSDVQGRVVCKTALTGSETLYTYYVYDNLGLLRGVLQPNFQTDASFSNSAFLYDYDDRGRVIKKQVPGAAAPGAGAMELVYDQYDRPVYSRDANQAVRGVWAFTKYDALNRPILTGEITSSATRAVLTGTVDTDTEHHEIRANTTAAGYSLNLTAPTTATEADVLTITFYDDYAFNKPTPTGFDYAAETGYPTAANTAVTSQITGGRAKMLKGDGSAGGWLTNVIYYDAEYRPIQKVRELYDLGAGATERISTKYKYDLAAVVTEQKTVQTVGGVTHTHLEVNTYDHADRLLSVKETVTANGSPPDGKTKTAYTLAQRYNTLGQLKSKWFHAYTTADTKYRRRTTYTNNIRGWLTEAKTAYQVTQGTDLPFYAFNLSYNNVLYAAQYSNGNITKMEWSGKDQAAFSGGLAFTYDKANRLLSAVKPPTATYTYADTESGITYDANGNIKTLNRAGAAVDNLSYTYVGNRLTAITDASASNTGVKVGASAYTYDFNGNMLTDGNRGAVLTYNYLDLPKTVAVGGKTFTYDYDAGGNKHKYAGDTVTVKYAGRFEYDGNNALKLVVTSTGQAVPSGDTLRFDYYLSDHLGNIRVVFDERGNILQKSDYYPFGLSIDRNNPATSEAARNNANRLLYNSKELQVGSGFVDYGARMYMPEIGRWGTVDPKSELFGNLTPYNFVEGNPIVNIDPDGTESQTIYDFDGNAHEITVKDIEYSTNPNDGNSQTNCCPGNVAKADATSVAGKITPQISNGSIQLPQREQGVIKNADSKLLSHEQGVIDGLPTAVTAAYSEAVMAKAIAAIWALRAAKTGGRVFWSGEGAMNIAMNYAKSTGGTTLEMTRAGQNLQNLIQTRNIPWSEARPMWQRLSTKFAQGTEGSAHFFPGTTVNPGSIWLNVEKPILIDKGVKIIIH